jgi:hypothetical protein
MDLKAIKRILVPTDFSATLYAVVREGPTWHGRRVATWGELFDASRGDAGVGASR